ncbi:fms-related tyrosine kinase 3 ligand [Buteo buteo]|uniref:fms-related tyrosine kinase 3 ligand n=1 Tax=Buteo buteo TaxID=30397 RepID=UPI003EBACE53
MDPAPPGSALVPLLLLLAVPPPGICCSFDFNPVSSTFSTHVDALTPWLILDYPVAMPSNLEMDSRCSDLWGLHFGAVALGRMAGVAGGSLAPRLQAVAAHIAFVAECRIHDPQGCVRLEVVNVSQLLGALVQHLGGLQGRPPHFPGCAHLRCRPGWDLSGRDGEPGTDSGWPEMLVPQDRACRRDGDPPDPPLEAQRDRGGRRGAPLGAVTGPPRARERLGSPGPPPAPPQGP